MRSVNVNIKYMQKCEEDELIDLAIKTKTYDLVCGLRATHDVTSAMM